MIAAMKGRDDIIRLLLGYEANVDAKGPGQTTALRIAAELRHLEVVRALIYGRASMDEPSEDGTTPLLIAAKNGHNYIVQLLVNQGADLNLQSHTGATALLHGRYVQLPGSASYPLGRTSERGFGGLLRMDCAVDGVFGGYPQLVQLILERRSASMRDCVVEPLEP